MPARIGRGLPWVAVAVGLVIASAAPSAAYHWANKGWRDHHYNYPAKPSGRQQIVARFGQPCNSNTNAIGQYWRAADDGKWYLVRFHRKLGGRKTEVVPHKGGWSTNLDNDVRGHILNQHLGGYVRRGIWGYACRYIRGTRKWSTHAWGIAVDVSSAWEPRGRGYSTVNKHHAHVWRNHRWNWGLSFRDPMHFQYAKNY